MLNVNDRHLVLPEERQKVPRNISSFLAAVEFPFTAGKIIVLNINNKQTDRHFLTPMISGCGEACWGTPAVGNLPTAARFPICRRCPSSARRRRLHRWSCLVSSSARAAPGLSQAYRGTP